MARTQTPPAQVTPSSDVVQEVPISSRQRLLPLLAMCALMMGVGFYFASNSGSSFTGSEERERALVQLEQEARLLLESLGDVAPVVEPIRFAYDTESLGAQRYMLEQSNAATSGAEAPGTSTSMAFVTRPQIHEAGQQRGERWVHLLGFDEVLLRVASPEEPHDALGEAVTDQLRKAIASSTLEVIRQDTGAVEQMTWQNRINAPVRPALAIIESAVALLSPVLPRTPVEQGASWYYEVMLPGVERDAMTLTGRVGVTTTLRGTRSGPRGEVWYVLTQEFEVTGAGEVRGDTPLSYELGGEGQGVVLFDAERGAVHQHSVEFVTRLRVRQGARAPIEVTSSYLLARLPATPEVREQ